MTDSTVWDEKILGQMRPGAITFAWDDGEIQTIDVPEGTLISMQSAWDWINPVLKEYEQGRGKPRSLCFRLANGTFRGLRFPDWRPGMDL
jgi:hypothetical protein